MSATRTEAKLSSGTLPYVVLGDGRPLLYLHAAGGAVISPAKRSDDERAG